MPLVGILVLASIVIIFGAVMLVLTGSLGPKVTKTPAKSMPYESGVVGTEKGDSKISVRFYLVAILFILFDIEIIFMYPWALIYKDFLKSSGAFIFIEMMVFMAILVFGLFYVWRAKALEWD